MIFRNTDTNKDYKSGYLYVNDIAEDIEPIPEELLKSMQPTKGKVVSGTFGSFNTKDFKRIIGELKDV